MLLRSSTAWVDVFGVVSFRSHSNPSKKALVIARLALLRVVALLGAAGVDIKHEDNTFVLPVVAVDGLQVTLYACWLDCTSSTTSGRAPVSAHQYPMQCAKVESVTLDGTRDKPLTAAWRFNEIMFNVSGYCKEFLDKFLNPGDPAVELIADRLVHNVNRSVILSKNLPTPRNSAAQQPPRPDGTPTGPPHTKALQSCLIDMGYVDPTPVSRGFWVPLTDDEKPPEVRLGCAFRTLTTLPVVFTSPPFVSPLLLIDGRVFPPGHCFQGVPLLWRPGCSQGRARRRSQNRVPADNLVGSQVEAALSPAVAFLAVRAHPT